MRQLAALAYALGAAALLACTTPTPPLLGQFEQAADIGDVGAPGATAFDPSTGAYRLTGAGANMWADTDAFHFAWRRMDGDLSIASDIAWEGGGQHELRKAGVMIRASLDPGAPYADVVVHGDGLTAMQYRAQQGGPTQQVRATIRNARRVRLEREGDYVFFSVAGADGVLHRLGGSVRLPMQGPYFVGLGVCSHVRGAAETAVFSNVDMQQLHLPVIADTGYAARVESSLEVLDVVGGSFGANARRIVRHFDGKIEAPNWSRDGGTLIYNADGLIYRIPVAGGEPTQINTGPLRRNNNDHGISPDGTQLIVSDQSEPDNASRIHILPITGSDHPRLLVASPQSPSYWHAWSPDGRTIVYVANRSGDYELYASLISGGPETRLTNTPGLDDGPDYSADGRFIYFNSERSGNMTLWRMRADGSEQTQITSDPNYRDWFPHPSPDGRWIAFVSFGTDVAPGDHPPNRDALLRIIPTDGSTPPRVLATIFGGQGSMNVPSWSPDSTQLAFVSYRLAR
jgi:TolB protein